MVRLIRLLAGAFIMACSHFTANAQPEAIIFSEIMADPLNESRGEYIELYNRGDFSVDIGGWQLADRSDVNDVIMDYEGVFDRGIPGTILQPGAYALIVDPDYDGAYNDVISTMADTTSLLMLTIRGDRTLGNGLGNSGDTIILDDMFDFRLSFTWTESTGENGRSWEKIDVRGEDTPSNWAPARMNRLATPGARNSVAPSMFDISISQDSVTLFPHTPNYGSLVTITITVSNAGTEPISFTEASVYIDMNQNDQMEPDEIVGHKTLNTIRPGASERVRLSWPVSSFGIYRIGIILFQPDDDEPDNNLAYHTVHIPFLRDMLVINEVMFDPEDGQPEWIELYNRSDMTVDLLDWTIETADSTKRRTITDHSIIIPADHYLILTADIDAFNTRYHAVESTILKPQGSWSALLNTGTTITLRDLTGSVVDRVIYEGDWSDRPGRSIERIHPSMPSLIETSWGPSSASSEATPGRQNSLYATRIPDNLTVHISPNPFSPDGDGVEDDVSIIVEIPSSRSFIRAIVFDIQGRRIRILSEERQAGNRWAATWDGRMDNGGKADIGPYIFFIEMQEPSRGIHHSQKRVIYIGKKL